MAEQDNERQRPEGTIPRNRPARFGWQSDEEVQYLDDDGNPISAEEFQRRLAADAEAARKG